MVFIFGHVKRCIFTQGIKICIFIDRSAIVSLFLVLSPTKVRNICPLVIEQRIVFFFVFFNVVFGTQKNTQKWNVIVFMSSCVNIFSLCVCFFHSTFFGKYDFAFIFTFSSIYMAG